MSEEFNPQPTHTGHHQMGSEGVPQGVKCDTLKLCIGDSPLKVFFEVVIGLSRHFPGEDILRVHSSQESNAGCQSPFGSME